MAGLQAVVHVHLDRVRAHAVARHFLHLQADVGIDDVVREHTTGLEEAADKDLYDLEPEEAKHIPEVCHSLDMALEHLDKDRGFLKAGGVFTDDVIDAYIGLKMQEVTRYRMSTHPVEMDMYYSL